MKHIITGKEGVLSQKLSKYLEGRHLFTSLDDSDPCHLNLERPEHFNYDLIEPDDIIFHLAAISSPDACENDYEASYKINVIGSKYFIKKCIDRGGRVIFFSSDTVYEGRKDEIYDEDSDCLPTGNYGKMKHEIEEEFKGESQFKAFRLSYVFSREDKYTSYLLNCLNNKKKAEVFHPFFRNVVYLQDLLEACQSIVKKWNMFENSIFNICGPSIYSRLELAEIFNLVFDNKLTYEVVNPGKEFFIARPEKIIVKSKFLEPLIDRKPVNIESAMKLEFSKGAIT